VPLGESVYKQSYSMYQSMCPLLLQPGAPARGRICLCRNRLSPGSPGTRRIPMNRVAGLILAGLVLLLGVTLTQSQPAHAQDAICPQGSGSPSEPCDSASNCFHHCCLQSGLCPSSSCVSSLDAPNDDRSNCSGSCLDEVACRPFNPACVPH